MLEDQADARLEVRQAFLELYAKRGDIAHQGHMQVSPRDVRVLANLVMGVLLGLVTRRKELDRLVELHSWIDRQRLA